MMDSDRGLCENHRKKDRSEKYTMVIEILIFREGPLPLRKIKIRNFFMMDSDRGLFKKHRKKNRSEKFLSVAEILIFREAPPPSKNKKSKNFLSLIRIGSYVKTIEFCRQI